MQLFPFLFGFEQRFNAISIVLFVKICTNAVVMDLYRLCFIAVFLLGLADDDLLNKLFDDLRRQFVDICVISYKL